MAINVAYIGNVGGKSTGPLTYTNILRDTYPKEIEGIFLDRYSPGRYDIVHFTDIKHTRLEDVMHAKKSASVVVEVHDYSFMEYVKTHSPDRILRKYYHRKRQKAYAKILDAADAVIVHSKYIKDRVEGSSLVYIGLPEGVVQSSQENKVRYNRACFVGRDGYQKGLDVVLNAMQKLKHDGHSIPLVIAGDEYPHYKMLFRLKALGLDVSFVGPLKRKDLFELYSASRVFLRPSYLEGFGLSILEALACGTPVIATRVGGIPEIITDGEEGYLVEPGDALALADRIVTILDDDDLWKEMSRKAIKKASTFTTEGMWRQLLSVYSRL